MGWIPMVLYTSRGCPERHRHSVDWTASRAKLATAPIFYGTPYGYLFDWLGSLEASNSNCSKTPGPGIFLWASHVTGLALV